MVAKRGKRRAADCLCLGEGVRDDIFADCSYEGDLMAQAKITYTWGRESSAQYG
jgi:hypothetical protein